MAQVSGGASEVDAGATPPSGARATGGRRFRFETVALAALVVAAAACFWPLTRYFFAQDDFVLLQRAAFTPGMAVTSFFGDHPGQFRPLSKGLYFVLSWRLFGLHAFPYHLVSLLLHAFNTVMVWRLLRRLKTGEPGALVATALFGLSAGFFHVIAWISCVQQLSGMAFSLVALELGFRAIDDVGSGEARLPVAASAGSPVAASVGSLAAWALALGCVEQAALLPLLFPAYAWAYAKGARMRRTLSVTAGHWVLLAVFGGFILMWKGIPREGVYAFTPGGNVGVNLATYAGWSLDYWMRLPDTDAVDQFRPGLRHGFAVLLVTYHLIRRRIREVVFALLYFLVFTLPVAFLSDHQFHLHTYLAAPAAAYLLALLVGDVFALPQLRAEDARFTALGVILVALVTLSWYSVRANETLLLKEGTRWRRSFVLRRAITAHNAWTSIRARWKQGVARQVVMVYGRRADTENARWNNRNVIEALGRGAAVQLFYGRPQPDVKFVLLDELGDVELDRADLYFYDDHGNCFSLSEFENRSR